MLPRKAIMGMVRAVIPDLVLLLPSFPTYAADEVTLQLRWHHRFQFAGYYAAKEKGFYRAAGFAVTIVAGAPGREPVNEVLAGRATYGIVPSSYLQTESWRIRILLLQIPPQFLYDSTRNVEEPFFLPWICPTTSRPSSCPLSCASMTSWRASAPPRASITCGILSVWSRWNRSTANAA